MKPYNDADLRLARDIQHDTSYEVAAKRIHAHVEQAVAAERAKTQAEREHSDRLAEALHKLAMWAETYHHERPVYQGKPFGAGGSPARIEQERQIEASYELILALRKAYTEYDAHTQRRASEGK